MIFRFRSAEDFAIFQFFNITAVGMATYGALGLGQAAVRFFAGTGGVIQARYASHVRVILAIGAAFSLFAAIAAFSMAKLMLGNAVEFRAQFAVLSAIYIYAAIVDGGMVGLGRFRTLLIGNILSATLLLVSFYFLSARLDLSIVIWIFCCAPAAALLWNSVALFKALPPRLRGLSGGVSIHTWNEIFSFSLPLFLTGFVYVSVPWLYGRLLQGSPEELRAFAHFSIGLQWFSLILLVPSMVTRVVSPNVFSEVDSSRPSRAKLIERAGANAVVAALVALLLVPLAPTVLALYGSEAVASRTDLTIMSFSAVFASTVGVVGTYVMASRGAFRWLLLILVWGLCATGSLLYLKYSGVGIFSLGYLIAYAVLCILAWANVGRRENARSDLEMGGGSALLGSAEGCGVATQEER